MPMTMETHPEEYPEHSASMNSLSRYENEDLLSPSSASPSREKNDYNDDESNLDGSTADGEDSPLQDEPKEEDLIGQSETKAVVRLKLVVFFVLVISATIASTSIYYYLSRYEMQRFEDQFRGDSHKVMEAAGSSLHKTLGLLDSVAVSYVSVADFTNQSWPFVSMPNFAVRMAKLLPLTDAIIINVLPLVKNELRREWEDYAVQHHGWVEESMAIQDAWNGYYGPIVYNSTPSTTLHSDFADLLYNETRDFLPLWQNFPVLANTTFTYNWDWYAFTYPDAYLHCMKHHQTLIAYPYMIEPSGTESAEELETAAAEQAAWGEYFSNFISPDLDPISPMGDIVYPIIDKRMIDTVQAIGTENETYFPPQNEAVGLIVASMYWRDLINGILPEGSNGIHVVFQLCEKAIFTYQINGPSVEYLGVTDKHETEYDHLRVQSTFQNLSSYAIDDTQYSGAPIDTLYCNYTLTAYPSKLMEDKYTSHNPVLFAVLAVIIFAFTSLVFYLYDATVEYRQKTVLKTAVRSTKIVSSLFPSQVRDKLYPKSEELPVHKSHKLTAFLPETAKNKLQSFVSDGKASSTQASSMTASVVVSDTPIAELYPDTTVLFADIAGFTSWSSSRQPTQVFILLETLYASFDEIARQRGVFKVETIGDCYLAVVGLPTPRKGHAVVMTRFAADCRNKMQELTMDLEKTLGPGTCDLALRIGLNSGPTTAGVLRGDKSRFQLFGDTVNTAARMESNGEPNRIHVSQKTAELIKKAGKGHWLTLRDGEVYCKGKGNMTTYWCEPRAESTVSSSSLPSVANNGSPPPRCSIFNPVVSKPALSRLVDWNVDILTNLLRHVVAHREANDSAIMARAATQVASNSADPLNEVVEVMTTLEANGYWDFTKRLPRDVKLDAEVAEQLFQFVTAIADLYRADNAFHNFEHCSHVVMATQKLLSRMSETCSPKAKGRNGIGSGPSSAMMGFCEILSDPLVHFGVVFAALIHEVDHPGLSNAHLRQEEPPHELVDRYNNRCMTEQNAIDVAWSVLMEARFDDLRACIFATQAEMDRFRQVVVHVVLATDGVDDAALQAMREQQWEATFGANGPFCQTDGEIAECAEAGDVNVNRRAASIVLDLIIQVSAVSHTMQHFTVYKKWNQNLLREMMDAYLEDRVVDNPVEYWYDTELAHYESYVVPLASKLRACGVFGVSCDEFLDYANDNRLEWQSKGRDIVQQAATGGVKDVFVPVSLSHASNDLDHDLEDSSRLEM